MYWYTIGQTLTQQERAPAPEQPAVVLLTSEELSHQPALPGLERTLHHTPPARDARVCKAEVRSDCLAGTLVLPCQGKDGKPLACGYLVTAARVVLVDDESALQGQLRRIAREKRWTDGSVGRFLYDFFEQLITRDLHRLEKIEDRIEALEDRVLAHELDDFSAPMTALRKETMAWFRYYSQLDDVACELHENENGFFTDSEQLLFRMFEDRVIRLREESQLLRESCAQLQSLFQAEIDTRQNRIMQIRLPRRRHREHRDRGPQPVGVQKEKVLVTKSPAEEISAGDFYFPARAAKCSGFSIDVSRSGNACCPRSA